MELVVGRVVKAHGITGEVVVDVRTDDPARPLRARVTRCAPSATRGGCRTRLRHRVVREHGGRLLVRLAGVADRDAADALRGHVCSWSTPPTCRRSTSPTSSTTISSKVCRCGPSTGRSVGIVAEVLHTAAGELLAVEAGRRWPEVLVPFVSAIVTSVSLDDGIVEIDPPEGLLDLD